MAGRSTAPSSESGREPRAELEVPGATFTDLGADVRVAFKVPRALLLDVKRIALNQDRTASALVREWVEAGLAGIFDELRPAFGAPAGPCSQFPFMLPEPTRRALQARCMAEDLSMAQLMRRWLLCGVLCSDGATSPN